MIPLLPLLTLLQLPIYWVDLASIIISSESSHHLSDNSSSRGPEVQLFSPEHGRGTAFSSSPSRLAPD